MKIEWAARARTDIRELRRYIAQDSPHYARRFVDKIFQAVEKLPEHPRLGRQVPEAARRRAGADLSALPHHLRHQAKLRFHREHHPRQP